MAVMMGHLFARVGSCHARCQALALFHDVGRAGADLRRRRLCAVSYTHMRASTRLALIDGGYWIVAYLAMGGAFWLLG